MSEPLQRELLTYEHLKAQLVEQFPSADEDTILDTLEGATNLHEMLSVIIRSRLDDMAWIDALRMRMSDMRERLTRLEQRAQKKKDVVAMAMERAGIRKLEQADFTVSLRQNAQGLLVRDENQIPDAFWKPQPSKLDRQGLIDALKSGKVIAGASLDNGGMTISVRTR